MSRNELWIQHHRFHFDQDAATFGHLHIPVDAFGPEVNVFCLEDSRQMFKIPGETCIPKGDYEIKLRREGGMHDRYRNSKLLAQYGCRHRGMLHLQNVPDFTWVYYHCGNEAEDTEGCPLVGGYLDTKRRYLEHSAEAYAKFYNRIADAILDFDFRVFTRITEGYPAPWEIG